MEDEADRPSLFLIPVPIGSGDAMDVIPESVLKTTRSLRYFIAENAKTARHYLKSIGLIPAELTVLEIDKHDPKIDFEMFFKPLKDGNSMGLLSEAGMPAIADPGAAFVARAHQENFKVVPLTGPSSLFLALASSGLSGQNFCFHGYLPKEKDQRLPLLQRMEKDSESKKQAQIFIETPYRNNQLLRDLLDILKGTTRVCIAADLTQPGEFVSTKTVRGWKASKLPELKDRPAIFIFQAG